MHPLSNNLPSLQDSCRGIHSPPFQQGGLEIEAPSVLDRTTKLSTSEDDLALAHLHMVVPSDVSTISINLEDEKQAMSNWQSASQGSAMDMTCLDEIWDMLLNETITQEPYINYDCIPESSPPPSQPAFSGSTACSQTSNDNLFNAPSPLFSEASSHAPNPHLLHQQDEIPSVNNMHKRSRFCLGLPESLWAPPSKRMVAPSSSSWCTPPCMGDSFFHQPSPYSCNEASSYAPSPPPQELNLEARASSPPPLNVAARTCLAESKLEGKASPFQPNLGTDHCMNGPGAQKKKTESSNGVQFIVESNTTAIDDGYIWRKYGQKNIKNKDHPRGYFRCAQDDCPVKKQTEASSDMPGFVLITYFGKHSHPKWEVTS